MRAEVPSSVQRGDGSRVLNPLGLTLRGAERMPQL